MFDTTGRIAIAQLVFFALALPVANYCFLKHWKTGPLGWFFLNSFCIIRIVGPAIIVSDESKNHVVSEAGIIITSVAVAPLVIAIGGLAHESFDSIKSRQPFLYGFIPQHLVHLTCVAAIALLVVGALNLEGTNKTPHDMKTGVNEIRGGGFILLAVWILLAVIILSSWRYQRRLQSEKKLLIGATVALGVLLLRILYTLLAALINSRTYNFRTGGPLAVKVIIDVLPEFLITLALLWAGIMSRNIKQEREMLEGKFANGNSQHVKNEATVEENSR